MTLDSESRETETGPFGPPDGARANWEEIRRNFVDFANKALLDDLASPPNDRTARVIVGKKGVGKTVYLRRFQANAEQEPSIYAEAVDHNVPATEDVIRVCELYPVELAAEGWRWIWRRAIMRALVSHLLWKPQLREKITPANLEALETEFRARLGNPRGPHGVYAEASAIAAEAHSKGWLARELRHRDWVDIENLLAEVLVPQPPICFYLDSVDEQFGSAPLYWLQCQKGLCQEVLELFRDERFGNRLHVVVSVRDLVRSSLLSGEHATRYLRVRHIRVLDWDHPSIRYLLNEKIRRLPERFCMNPEGDGVRRWLGTDEIGNPSRGVTERLEDYLLRHTRQIPRDVVQLGNELCEKVEQARKEGEKAVSGEAIRNAVGAVSKEFAEEQIAVCANHLASDMMPVHAGRHDQTDFYTSSLYTGTVQDELCSFIKAVGTDRFPMRTLKEALDGAEGQTLRSHPNPLKVLWLNGLLGYDPPDETQDQSHFYGAHDVADFQLPDDMQSYVFHPIVGHKVRIAAAGDKPVRPFR
jgi:hypothetical protein